MFLKKFQILVGAWSIASLMIFFSSFKEQVFIPKKVQKHIGTIFPEGWGFFTKNPRDPLLEVYEVKNDILTLTTIKNQSAQNIFGLSRKSRIVGYESSMIANEVLPKYWSKDKMGNLHQLKMDTIFSIKNNNNKYLKKGIYLFVTYEMVPFAWAKQNQNANNPINYIFVNINE